MCRGILTGVATIAVGLAAMIGVAVAGLILSFLIGQL